MDVENFRIILAKLASEYGIVPTLHATLKMEFVRISFEDVLDNIKKPERLNMIPR